LRRPANNGNLFRFYRLGGDAEAPASSYGDTPLGKNCKGRYEGPELGEALNPQKLQISLKFHKAMV